MDKKGRWCAKTPAKNRLVKIITGIKTAANGMVYKHTIIDNFRKGDKEYLCTIYKAGGVIRRNFCENIQFLKLA
ncbi:MAG: hypothetical protein LUE90_07300 [Clostridiales bacterium]|nr:hypothetical protein [Clostridiales bacterium]